MKKIKMTLAALAVAATASAYDFPYLSFETTGGEVVSVSVENLEMTVADGKLTVIAADGTKEFTVAELSRMFFSSEATGISEATAEVGSGKKKVYTVSGTYVGTYGSAADIKAALGSGLYIVKDNNNTTKITVR